MTLAAILFAILRFACWEAALFGAAVRLAGWLGWGKERSMAERVLAVVAIEVTLESGFAAVFSFAGWNSAPAYWSVAAVCAVFGAGALRRRGAKWGWRTGAAAAGAAVMAPLILLSFKPVEEIDSINYLHYLIDWMANRATPYTFATNYVAFWELSFLPAWMVTGVDLFFPILALKAVVLLALALWLVGEELGVECRLLGWTVFSAVLMRHFWFEYSGVPTLKNDALHGVGFVLLALVVLRAARRELTAPDIALLAFGASFGAVKYTGIFVAAIAVALVVVLRRPRWLALVGAAVVFLLTSGHYYLHNLLLYGSPFYPFQINLGFVHLPGTADLSNTSILYSLRDPRLWRALFLPSGGVSPAGVLFPAILGGVLVAGGWRCAAAAWAWLRHRSAPAPLDWAASLLLAGWLLYFRSVFSASASPGDLAFIVNSLNSVRYVDGVLAMSEVFLVLLLARRPWLAGSLVAMNAASRLAILYAKIPSQLFPPLAVCAIAVLAALLFLAMKRWAPIAAVGCLLVAGPFLVERNRALWTTYWNDLKPALAEVRGTDLAELALPDGGYFAGHVVAAGNPVDRRVRTLLPEEMDALAPNARPRFLAVMLTPGSETAGGWRARYGAQIARWGYVIKTAGALGAIFERSSP